MEDDMKRYKRLIWMIRNTLAEALVEESPCPTIGICEETYNPPFYCVCKRIVKNLESDYL